MTAHRQPCNDLAYGFDDNGDGDEDDNRDNCCYSVVVVVILSFAILFNSDFAFVFVF